ncbi:MAG TPA: acyl-CoA dehydrogenase family protein [Acidimicrobiia bacterium]
MFIDLTDEQRALRDEIDAYFAGLMTPERRAAMGAEGFNAGYREVIRQLGKDRWLGVGWPAEYGGRGWGALEQLIFVDAASRAGVALPAVTLNTVGPTLAQYGTDEQKQRFLPAILAGDVHFAIGYTEPEAGTDLASLSTRAIRDGDEYVVNGQKVFTSGGHDADFIWLAARTDPDAPKHEGISILIVDTTDPGFSFTPFGMIGRGHNNATYYDNVRVPVSMRVGPEHGGWKMITTQLNFERVMLGPSGNIFKSLRAVTDWARETTAADGRKVIDREWVRLNLAKVRAKVEAAELFNWRVASRQEQGGLNPADASAMKVFGTELRIESLRLLLEVVGVAGTLKKGSAGAVLAADLENEYAGATIGTFGGGVNEIQREIIGMAGLRMPRVPR